MADSIAIEWFRKGPNFGDWLSPWLVHRISGKSVGGRGKNSEYYLIIGSIVKTGAPSSIVWGTGLLRPRLKGNLCKEAKYLTGPMAFDSEQTHH